MVPWWVLIPVALLFGAFGMFLAALLKANGKDDRP